MATKIITLQDAVAQRLADDARVERRIRRSAKRSPAIEANLDPRIGVLIRNGRPVYYAFLGGQTSRYIERRNAARVLEALDGTATS